MSLLTSEQSAVQLTININPFSLTVSRPVPTSNARGVNYSSRTIPSTVVFDNPVRIVLMDNKASKIIQAEGKYNNTKTYYIIADFETVIMKHDRFTYQGRDWEILDVETILVCEGIKNYQAELLDLTQKVF